MATNPLQPDPIDEEVERLLGHAWRTSRSASSGGS
jgi:hypothetical protein